MYGKLIPSQNGERQGFGKERCKRGSSVTNESDSYLRRNGMENAARNARAANPSAKYGCGIGAGTTSAVRGVLPNEEEVVGGVDKINCTYPIDFNPWMLKTRFRISIPLLIDGRGLLVPFQVPLNFAFLTQRNTIQSEFHGS